MSADQRLESGPPVTGVILEAKLHPPPLHPEHVARPRLLRLLDAGMARKLTLVDAPAGFGKSTLLAEWCAHGMPERRCAWLSLDEVDNDLTVFWTYMLHALRQVEPEHFGAGLSMLGRQGVASAPNVLPELLNELWSVDRSLVLVLDDFHELTDAGCYDALRFLIRRLPPSVHLVIATRADPPLGLAALRARGDLAELRAAELRFTAEETESLLNGRLGLALPAEALQLLAERTEGWPAGLYLAALSLRDRSDATSFIADFTGQHHHLVDYLGDDVLGRLPAETRDFLLQTSLLESFTAPLCDAVTLRTDALQQLTALERTNQFLIPLDERRGCYRYHQLFRELLQMELRWATPDLVPELHRRAATWYRQAGDTDATIRHALAAEDYKLVAELCILHARPRMSADRLAAVVGWLQRLPETVVAADPPLALIAAWACGLMGMPPAVVEGYISMLEESGFEGPFLADEPSLTAAVALLRASFPADNVGRALAAAETAVATSPDANGLTYMVAQAALGHSLYLAGRPAEAEAALTAALHARMAEQQPVAAVHATAMLALTSLAQGDSGRAAELAQRAVAMRTALGAREYPLLWVADVALGTALARQGRLDEAEAALAAVETILDHWQRWPIFAARALLALAPVRFARGHLQAAQTLLAEARAIIAGCRDPGMLPALLAETERGLHRLPRRVTGLREELSESELRILRLLAGDLSQREIGQELYLSVNTIKTHTRAIYTKLDVASRAEAVSRARSLGLIA